MIILVSNDDGIHAEGLIRLAEALQAIGEVWIVAPDQPQNAVGRALTLHRPLRAVQVADRKIAVNGTPSDCVNLAMNGLLPEKPAVVVSGINHGANMADDIPYSGTVAAAFEATLWGTPAVAVSLHGKNSLDFSPAARFAVRVVRSVLAHGLPSDIFLNVNLPDTGGNDISSYRITKQGKSMYAGLIERRLNPRGEPYYWIGGDGTQFHDVPGSDAEAVLKYRCASITPIRIDCTDYASLDLLNTWRI